MIGGPEFDVDICRWLGTSIDPRFALPRAASCPGGKGTAGDRGVEWE